MAQFPSENTAYGIWSLNEIRDARRGSNWPILQPVVTSITRSVSTADEGDTVTFTVNTNYYSDGSTLYYDITGSGITTGDFTDSALSGSFTITNDSGVVTKTITEDNTTEGTETFTFNVRSGSTSGTILESTTVTINDTSVTQSFTTDTTFGTLVGMFNTDFEDFTGTYQIGFPQTNSSGNIIVSDSDFQSIRSSTSRVYYRWRLSDGTIQWARYVQSSIENADDIQAPTNTINPNNFGVFRGRPNHWWDETSGFSATGADYSYVTFRSGNTVSVYQIGGIKAEATQGDFGTSYGGDIYNPNPVDWLQIWYS